MILSFGVIVTEDHFFVLGFRFKKSILSGITPLILHDNSKLSPSRTADSVLSSVIVCDSGGRKLVLK